MAYAVMGRQRGQASVVLWPMQLWADKEARLVLRNGLYSHGPTKSPGSCCVMAYIAVDQQLASRYGLCSYGPTKGLGWCCVMAYLAMDRQRSQANPGHKPLRRSV